MVVPLGIMVSLRSIHKHLWWPLTLKPETKFVTPRFKGKGRTVKFFYNFHMSTKLTAWIIVCAWWKGSEPCDVFSLLWCMLLVSCHCTAADSQPLSSRRCHYMGTLSDLLALLIWGKFHDDVIKWKHFPRYWPFVRGIHRSPVNSPHKGQWRGALMSTLICARINGWVNNREAGDLGRYRPHHDVIVMHRSLPQIRNAESNFVELVLEQHPSGRWIGTV